VGSLQEVLLGPACTDDGSTNLFGGLRRAMAMTGYSSIKEFQKVEVMVAPAVRTEGKALQHAQGLGMGVR
jgi:IMP dehydrogenase